jgi:hypothetical protein
MSQASVVGITTGYGLDAWGSISGTDMTFSPTSQTVSGTHQNSSPVGLGGSFSGGKATEEWRLPLTFIL